jgi:putative ABC transport system substrate-binding protein
MTRVIRLLALLAVLVPTAVTPAHAADPVPHHIMMLLFRGCEEACQAFQDYFRRQRIPVRFTVRDAAQDASKVPGFVAEAKQLRPDLLVTWGTSVTMATVGKWGAVDPARHVTDIPVLFMIVSQPLELGIVPSLASSKRNITGTLYLLRLEDQLQAARSYFDFRRVGFLVNPAEANSKASLDELKALAGKFNYSVTTETLDVDPATKKPLTESLPAKVDALAKAGVDILYMSPDSFLNANRQIVTGTALAAKLPVFAAAEAPVTKADALFGVVNRYDQVGRFTAYQAVRILRDRVAPSAIAIELPRQFSFLINLRAARELQRYPPLPLLDIAEIVQRPCPASFAKIEEQLRQLKAGVSDGNVTAIEASAKIRELETRLEEMGKQCS